VESNRTRTKTRLHPPQAGRKASVADPPRTRTFASSGYTPRTLINQALPAKRAHLKRCRVDAEKRSQAPRYLYACLHPVALALRFERLGGELLNRLTALNGGELDPPAQRRRDTDAEHHLLMVDLRRPQTLGARRDSARANRGAFRWRGWMRPALLPRGQRRATLRWRHATPPCDAPGSRTRRQARGPVVGQAHRWARPGVSRPARQSASAAAAARQGRRRSTARSR
jgi:hypothetical protein